ncbi:MAG: hypothetical protein H8D23_18380 [Candidatus Brocadiales bacterium]|nr:hypothetical protein [Candidatus Brocadiales bacterium]
MKVDNKQMESLKVETEKIAKEQDQPITGYITEYTIMYMETGFIPVVSPKDSILYEYSSGSEPVVKEKKEVKKRKKKSPKKPKVKKNAVASKKK